MTLCNKTMARLAPWSFWSDAKAIANVAVCLSPNWFEPGEKEWLVNQSRPDRVLTMIRSLRNARRAGLVKMRSGHGSPQYRASHP